MLATAIILIFIYACFSVFILTFGCYQECSKHGTVMHSYVESRQPGGLVYVMFSTIGAATVSAVLSCPLLSFLVLCHVMSRLVLSFPALPCHALSCPVVKGLGLSHPVLPSLASRCVALRCLVLPCLALPCLALPCLALPCLALPCFSLSVS